MFDRRDFIKICTVTGISLTGAFGYWLMQESQGHALDSRDPYYYPDPNEFYPNSESNSVPILIIVNEKSVDPFGRYMAEILRVEGVNCFRVIPLDRVDSELIGSFDITILTEGELAADQVNLFRRYLLSGGRMIALRPSAEACELFGIDRVSGTIKEGYLQIDQTSEIAKGICQESMQFHGSANKYLIKDAQTIAWISEDRNMSEKNPGIVIRSYGEGLAAMFAFDLPMSIAFMRQGNPAWANQERDGLDGIRTVDMFKDWIDLERIEIPQADEKQRLFVNLLNTLSQSRCPLPRLWYFPDDVNSVLIATGDCHNNPDDSIEEILDLVETYDGVMSIYYAPYLTDNSGRALRRLRFMATDLLPFIGEIMDERYVTPTPAKVAAWRSRGHEFTFHPYVEDGVESGWRRYAQEFTGRGYGEISESVRTHRILWNGWVETARIQASLGVRLNMDFYHVGPSMQKADGEWVFGHMTGSGQPMKFIDEHGRVLNIYQQLTQLSDEHILDWSELDVYGWYGWPRLGAVEAVRVSQNMIRKSIGGDFTPITAQFHVDPFAFGGESSKKARLFMEGTLDFAAKNDVPITSAEKWLFFSDLRQGSLYKKVLWDSQKQVLIIEFEPYSDLAHDLVMMVPFTYEKLQLSGVEIDSENIPFKERVLSGTRYAAFSLPSKPKMIQAYFV